MALREILARFGFDIDQAGLATATMGIDGVIGRMQAFAGIIAGTAIVRGIANFVGSTVKMGDELGDTADKLGMSAQELQRWRAAVSYAGGEAGALQGAIRILSRTSYEAAKKGGDAEKAYKDLGIQLKDGSGKLRTQGELLHDAVFALAKVTNGTERTAKAQKILGRGAMELGPMFAHGTEGVKEFLSVIDEAGGPFGEDFIDAADRADKSFKLFGLATDNVKSRLATAFLPTLTLVTVWLARAIGWISKITANTNVWRAILLTLGAAIVKLAIAKFGGDLLGLARAVAGPLLKFALLILIIDDFFTMLQGGDSVLGRFLDKLFGEGTASNVAATIGGIIDSLKAGDFEGAINKAADALEALGGAIVTFFSGESTGPIAEFFSVVGSKIVAFFVETLPALIKSAAGIVVAAALDLGKAIIDGIVAAIKGGASAIGTELANAATAAIGKVKSVLRIHSPSKVAGDELGEPLGEGVVVGWQKALDGAAMGKGAIAAMTADAPSSASAPARGGASVGPGGVVFQTSVQLSVSGNPNDAQVGKLRQGLRAELNDNRQAMLAALQQTVEVPG